MSTRWPRLQGWMKAAFRSLEMKRDLLWSQLVSKQTAARGNNSCCRSNTNSSAVAEKETRIPQTGKTALARGKKSWKKNKPSFPDANSAFSFSCRFRKFWHTDKRWKMNEVQYIHPRWFNYILDTAFRIFFPPYIRVKKDWRSVRFDTCFDDVITVLTDKLQAIPQCCPRLDVSEMWLPVVTMVADCQRKSERNYRVVLKTVFRFWKW